MARPRVADGGDGLQIWRVAASILNKQSWRPTRVIFQLWSLGEEANNVSPQKDGLLRNLKPGGSLDLPGPCEHGNEPLGSLKSGEFLD
jgi:hypothetical protein